MADRVFTLTGGRVKLHTGRTLRSLYLVALPVVGGGVPQQLLVRRTAGTFTPLRAKARVAPTGRGVEIDQRVADYTKTIHHGGVRLVYSEFNAGDIGLLG